MKAIKKEVNNPCEVIDIDCRYACDVIKAVPELGYIERVPMETTFFCLRMKKDTSKVYHITSFSLFQTVNISLCRI